jgi:outer membrane protein assembly factor BamB
MDLRRKLVFVLTLIFMLSAQTATAQIEQRCVLLIDRFEDTTDLPQFRPVFDQVATVDGLISFDIDTEQPVEQTGLSFALVQAPDGMSIDSSTGVVSWQPDILQTGVVAATVLVSDSQQRRNRHTFCIEVVDPSVGPRISPIADTSAFIDEDFSQSVQASDGDPGDVITFSLDQAPAGMTINEATGLIEWRPVVDDAGVTSIVVRASDLTDQFDLESFELTVIESNQPPVIAAIADFGAQPGVDVAFPVAASDPDGDDLVFSVLERPAGLVIDPDSGLISWVPVTQQLGIHPVTVRVSDPLGFTDQVEFAIRVDVNRAPVAVNDPGYRVELGETLTVPASGVLANDTDPNDDPLSSAVTQPPQLGTLALSSDGSFEYTPDTPVGTIGFELDWAALISGGGGAWMPIIANMDDDPQSEILVNKAFNCCEVQIRSYDGLDGALDWSVVFGNREIATDSQPVVADIDLDGKPELIVLGGEPDLFPSRVSFLYAFEHDGSLKWVSEEFPRAVYLDGSPFFNSEFFATALTVADLDQDGLPEILAVPTRGRVQFTAWDHEGQLIRTVSSDQASLNSASTHATTVDLDLDGDLEVVVGGTAWHHDGTLIWSLPTASACDSADDIPFCFSNTFRNNFPRVANLDDDPYPELIRTRGAVFAGDRRADLFAINHDGSLLWAIETPGLGTAESPLAVADVNLDGYADVIRTGPVNENYVEARDGRDGTLLWSATLETRHAGATVFDMDRDGFPEVIVYGRLGNLHVLNGQDGSSLLVFQTPATLPPKHTTPVFADIDVDGQAELVVSLGNTFGNTPTVAVYQSPGNDWAPMRSIWNEWGYRVTNINEDLTIPTREKPHWLQPGLNQVMVNQRLPESRNEDENQDRFFYQVSDGELQSNEAEVTIDILPPNAGPRILSTAPELASPGFEYVYNVLAVDADPGDQLGYTLAEGPGGMAIDDDGSLTWTPALSDLGTVTAVISVTDSQGVFTLQSFLIEVRDPVQVPDLAGLTEAAAIAELQALTLDASPLRDTFSDTIPSGIVAAQSPSPATTAAAGSAVAVDISRGPIPVVVPTLIGLDQVDAQELLMESGLQTGTVEWRNDPGVPRGVVLEQDPAPITGAPPGSSVALLVSGGPRATITVSPRLIPSGSTAGVAVQVNDVDGTLLDPQPDVMLSLAMEADDVFGTAPLLNGTTIETGADSQGRFVVEASFMGNGAEQIAIDAAILPDISDGPGGRIYTEFAQQLETFNDLVAQLIDAVDTSNAPAIAALDQQLGDLEAAIDLRRLRTMTLIAPEGGVLPTPAQARAEGLFNGPDDRAYRELSLDLTALLSTLNEVVREGTAPDRVLASINQDLAAAAARLTTLEPNVLGVLESTPSLIALLGTYAPQLLVADIQAVRQTLRDEGIIDAEGSVSVGRFSLVGIMSASRIRQTIIRDFYLPYVGDVAQMMGSVIAGDLLQPLVNGGSIAGIITGSSLAIHVFDIPNSVIEGFGFDPTLSPNNAVIMVGPDLIDAVVQAASGLPGSEDFKDINSAIDSIQNQIDNGEALQNAYKAANSTPMGVRRDCILDNRPGCRQLIYPDGFASVHTVESGLSLPGSVLILVRNLESGANALFVANFVPARAPQG